jgi:phospholipid/cholesterol/gamma-HCH transport system permease protein
VILNKIFAPIGRSVLSIDRSIEAFGKFIVFQLSILPLFFKFPLRIKETINQIYLIGVGTLGVILLTAFFTGMVMAIQLYSGFNQFGIEAFIGYTVFISITKELGPVFGALMVVSRAISSMSAELGTMSVSEQIDAMETLGVDSKKLLIIPRIVATTISLPILVIIFDFVGNISAFLISVYALDLNPNSYQSIIMQNLQYSDIYSGVIKAFIFGFFISSIGTYIGYFTSGGAKGVGISTTKAVVFSAITIFAANYFISSFFLILGF